MIAREETPIDILRQMSGGFFLTQILYTAVRLGIADQLANGPKQSHELARSVNASPQALYRFLRMMVVLKLLFQEDDGGFRLSPLGDLLCSDHSDKMRERILYIGEVNYPVAQGMLHAVQTGEPAFDYIFGMPFFDYLERHPYIDSLFNVAMGHAVDERVEGIVAAYDFSKFSCIVDVGAGNGALITGILHAYSHPRGIIFDMPKVVAEAQNYLAENGMNDRCQTVTGDFFKDTIPSGDLYILSNIIHDWDDNRAAQILRNCREVMSGDGKLLLIEQFMPKQAANAPVTVSSDLSMLLHTSGRERTEEEFRALFSKAGLQLTEVFPFEPSRIFSGRKPNWVIMECKP